MPCLSKVETSYLTWVYREWGGPLPGAWQNSLESWLPGCLWGTHSPVARYSQASGTRPSHTLPATARVWRVIILTSNTNTEGSYPKKNLLLFGHCLNCLDPPPLKGRGLNGTVWFELLACYHQNLRIFWGVCFFSEFFFTKKVTLPWSNHIFKIQWDWVCQHI